ncbi:MAG: isopenicillin N synthase family oxygenase [Chromatiales bacterium]|jgi:isopenicillin N synthase-like dioxygenase|nr:isopenicillin N synthase family oxygenase [Chromatiales bacterium]
MNEVPIPTLDVSAMLAGQPGALESAAEQLRQALEEVGFYYLVGHGVSRALRDSVFDAVERFHAQPLESKLAIRANVHNVGYMPVNGYVSRSSRISTSNKPNLVEALFVKRDLAADHPDVIANKLYRPANQWPDGMPGFRDVVVAYCDAMESLCLSMLPVYARALELPADYFADAFSEPQYALRMSHYPPAETGDDDQFGVAPHTDSSFLTMLAQADLPGLEVRMPDGAWLQAPAVADGFVVNSGDMLRRWTNHRFLSTPHRVRNLNPGKDRYAIPFFFDATVDYPMACLPSCRGLQNPPRYEPVTYTDYMVWFTSQYDHVREHGWKASDPGIPQ